MARTAPVPNIPAIPGMNPGTWIMGGGGGGGGGNGDGSGNGGGQNGSGQNGGNGVSGGGKDANGCGPGSGGGCPNPAHGGGGGTHAGDPVDPVSGRVYTVAAVDLALPGLIPLVITRSYSSASREHDIGLGSGWSHALAWHIESRRLGLRVHAPHASPTDAPRLEPGASVRLPCGRLTRHAWGYTLEADGLTRIFRQAQGARVWLSAILDAHDNAISLRYEAGALVEITDSVGRVIRLQRYRDGHIKAFEVKNASEQGRWVSFRSYTFDERGDLVAALDAEGNAERFAYDAEHRLVRRSAPGGLVAEFRYNAEGRCVESFCHREGNDGLGPSVPATLRDGSRAKGFLHVKIDHHGVLTEVITSRAIRRIEGNAFDKADKMVWNGGVHTFRYDEAGELLAYSDAEMHTWRRELDPEGRLRRVVDPLGSATEYTYDERGGIVAMTDALGGTARYERGAHDEVRAVFDDLGFVVDFTYDDRGLLVGATLPNGGVTRMEYDGLANRVRVVEPDGSERRIRYDFLGRVQGFTDERGFETRYAYDNRGLLAAIYHRGDPSGAVTRYGYDADGNRTTTTDADGRTTTLRWGGIGVVTEILRPDGSRVQYRYDREQALVRIVNELGEEHRIERDAEGRIIRELTFDGRDIRYQLDVQGRITRMRCGAESVLAEYDALGRLLKRSTSDGREDVFSYDPLGRLERAESDGVESAFTYDARGRVVREVTRRGGEVLSDVAWSYDSMGKVVSLRGPEGDLACKRDVMGRPVEVQIGASESLRFAYDAAGYETMRALPGGGALTSEVDAAGLLAQQSVLGPPRPVVVAPNEPAWVGPPRTAVTWQRAYAWSPAGLLAAEDDPVHGGRRELSRDANGRVVERRRAGEAPERYGFSASGDLYTASEQRTYAPGGRLIERRAGAWGEEIRYAHDERGQVTEKRIVTKDGERIWGFEWSSDGRLLSVRKPDGAKVAYAYDAFARRIEARVSRAGLVEGGTRYAWRGDLLAREVRLRAQAGGDPVVEERSYVTLPESVLPLGERGGAAGALRYFVWGTNGLPEALVGGDGRVVGALDASLYGEVPAAEAGQTALRFPGQYADAETGLYYNGHRYYDPETGAYLSPEPLGIGGSLKAYAYVDGYPDDLVDPNALLRCVLTRRDGSQIVRSSGGSEESIHPAVAAALPRTSARQPGDPRPPEGCAEPQALSDHIRDWERRTGRSCAPGDRNWRRNLGSALREVNTMRSETGSNDAVPACPNCSQLIPRLWTMAGQSPPSGRVIGGGTNPSRDYLSNPTSQLSRPNDHGSMNLGRWGVDNGQFVRR